MPDPLVLDSAGNPRDLEWLRAKYGPFVIHDPPPLPEGETAATWRITTLREKLDAPATLIFQTRDAEGKLLPGVRVAWYWPDADADPNCGPLGAPFEGVTPARAVTGYTNVNGDIGFAMGPGAFYWADRGERGPHATWIYGAQTRSQLILGLGMLAGTNHFHFDVEFTLADETGGEEPIEEEEFLELMDRIACAMERIADYVDTYGVPLPNATDET